MFLLACQRHSNVTDSGKTVEMAFRKAESQLVLIDPGIRPIIG
jgi:hypothetical protein